MPCVPPSPPDPPLVSTQESRTLYNALAGTQILNLHSVISKIGQSWSRTLDNGVFTILVQ